jgi:cytochrome c5
MRLRTATTFIVLVASAALAGPTPPAGQLIDVWIRPSGDAPRKPITIDLSTKPKTEVTRDDFQYEGMKAKYRGVSLRALLDTLERPGRTDLALLHFNNGMIIPLPTDDYELMKTLDPFVATELKVNDLWITAFPMVTKKGAEGRDVRPLKFQFNKVVVGTNLHPFTSKAAQADGFSPFFFADSLVGIELVRAENWYKQFDVGTTPEEKRGFAVFKSHCQYCHATREVGGRYGIDFMKPKPVVERVGVQDLFLHVRYRDRNAPETGQMMPFFKDLQKDDVVALHAWLTALTRARPVPYVAPVQN